jgi:hypothetical protein
MCEGGGRTGLTELEVCGAYSCTKVYRPGLVPKIFCLHPSHRMFGHMHGVLNVDEKKLIAQFSKKSRDESFKPN